MENCKFCGGNGIDCCIHLLEILEKENEQMETTTDPDTGFWWGQEV